MKAKNSLRKLSEIPAHEREEWNKKYQRFKRKWIKKNPKAGLSIAEVHAAFCAKHNLETL
jgi:hypothetical protein